MDTTTENHLNLIESLSWNFSGSKLASGSYDETAKIWQTHSESSLSCINTLKGHSSRVTQVRWKQEKGSNILATCSKDKSVKIWDLSAGESPIMNIVTDENPNISMSWSPDRNYIAVGEKTLTLIDLRNQKPLPNPIEIEVNDIAWVDEFIFVASKVSKRGEGGEIKIFKFDGSIAAAVVAGEKESNHPLNRIGSLCSHRTNCTSIEFDRQKNRFATSGVDSIVCIWDYDELICTHSILKHDSTVRGMSFNHDGSYLCSISENYLEIAAADTGEPVDVKFETKEQPSKGFTAVSWHPTSNVLAFAKDKQIKLTTQK